MRLPPVFAFDGWLSDHDFLAERSVWATLFFGCIWVKMEEKGIDNSLSLCYDKATPRRKRSSLRAHGQESPGMVEPGRMDEDEWTFEGEPNRR